MAASTAAPRKRTTPAKSTATKRAPAKAAAPATEEVEVVKEIHELNNMGRTKGGEGKQEYWNLHVKGARGQIFAEPGATRIAVLIEYPAADAEEE